MYLTERMIALFTYSVFLGIICFLIIILGRKYINKILLAYVCILTTMSFFYVPASGADLYRLIPIMHIWANLNISELWQELVSNTTPASILYMHIIGKMKVDGLLPAITALIFYRNVFYLFKKSVDRFNVSARDTALVLFFFMSLGVLIEVISGIRTMLGLSIIAVCMYQEMVEGKSFFKNIIWYISASLFHPAVFVMTGLRVGYIIFEKNKNKLQTIYKAFILLCSFGIIFVFGKNYLFASLAKGQEYLFNDSYSYFWEYVIGFLSLFIILFVVLLTNRLIKIEGDTNSNQDLLGFIKLLSMVVILLAVEYNTFHRFVIFLSIMFIPLLMNLLSSPNQKRVMKINIRFHIFYISCVLLLIAASRGNLTSLKFFIF